MARNLRTKKRKDGLSSGCVLGTVIAAPQDRFTEEEIAYFTREAQVPTAL